MLSFTFSTCAALDCASVTAFSTARLMLPQKFGCQETLKGSE